MKYSDLKLTAKKSKSRVGRGISAGQGKTAGRGTKGYGSRTGSTRKPGFEGGQNPMMQRLPKMRGFKSHRATVEEVKLSDVAGIKGGIVDNFTLHEAGLVSSPHVFVKLIGTHDLKAKLSVKLQKASKVSVEVVTNAGGSFTAVDRVARPESKKKEESR